MTVLPHCHGTNSPQPRRQGRQGPSAKPRQQALRPRLWMRVLPLWCPLSLVVPEAHMAGGRCLLCTLSGLPIAKCASPSIQYPQPLQHLRLAFHDTGPVSPSSPHQMSHPLPFHVPWFPRFALLEIPFLLPGKRLLILEAHCSVASCRRPLSPAGGDCPILPASSLEP